VQVRQIAEDCYDLAVSRSFAGSLWRAMELAGAGRLSLQGGQ
jgi:sarcosine oxidase gamma subunit